MSFSLGVMFGLVTMLGWGCQKLVAKKLLDRIGAYSALVYGNSTLVAIIMLYCLFTGTFAVPSPKTAVLIVILALFGALGISFLYKSMEKGKISIVVPVSHIYPIFILAIAFFLFDERLTGLQLLAVILAIFGTILVSWHPSEMKKMNIKKVSRGIPYALAAAVMWGITFALIKIIVDELGIFVTSLYFETFVVIFLLMPFIFGFAKLKKPNKTDTKLFLVTGALIAVGALSYNAGISMELVSIVGPLSAASMMVAVLLSWIFLKEKIEVNQKIAIAMIFAGIVLLAL